MKLTHKQHMMTLDFVDEVSCSRSVAIEYLQAEDWIYSHAVKTYRLDLPLRLAILDLESAQAVSPLCVVGVLNAAEALHDAAVDCESDHSDQLSPVPLTPAERQAARRERLKAADLFEVRGIFLPLDLHPNVKQFASSLPYVDPTL